MDCKECHERFRADNLIEVCHGHAHAFLLLLFQGISASLYNTLSSMQTTQGLYQAYRRTHADNLIEDYMEKNGIKAEGSIDGWSNEKMQARQSSIDF